MSSTNQSRAADWKRLYPEASESEWRDWRWQSRKMIRSLAVGLLFLASTAIEAESPALIRSQFGPAHAQRFRIGDRIRLSIDYDASGAVLGTQIASADYLMECS